MEDAMSRRISYLGALAIVGALLAGCVDIVAQAQEPPTFTISSGETLKWKTFGTKPSTLATLGHEGKLTITGPPRENMRVIDIGADWWCEPKSAGGFTCGEVPATVRLGQVRSWDAFAPICNCLSVANCCGMSDTAISTPGTGQIVITPGQTTISNPGLKVYATPLGPPCGDALPMPGCLPPEDQGWLVQIEGGDEQYFDVAFTWLDVDGKEHTKEEARIPRQPPFQGKPSFTAIPFRVGRAKNAFFPVGTVAVRTVVTHYTPKVAASVEYER